MILVEDLHVRLVFAKAESDVLAKINTKKYEKFSYFLDMRCERAGEILKEVKAILVCKRRLGFELKVNQKIEL